MTSRAVAAVAVVVAGGLLAGGCSGSAGLAETDPEGHEACIALADALNSDSARKKIGGTLEAGDHAAQASTRAIRDTAKPLLGQHIADVEQLHAACIDAGEDMPPLPDE